MENLWLKSHHIVLDMKVGDFYLSGGHKVSVIERTKMRIRFSNGNLITIKNSQYGFYHLVGKNVNQILRDIEGQLVFLKHDHNPFGYSL
jgi:hypothetical protein